MGTPRRKDLTGQRFGRLVAIEFSHKNKYRTTFWKFQCDCGNQIITAGADAVRGKVTSCGCLQKETATTHGYKDHRLYNTWAKLNHRCYNENDKSWENYGKRGITVCERWRYDNPLGISNFIEDMNSTFQEGLSINRINVNGNYEPSNCEWANDNIQAHARTKRKGCSSKYIGVSFNKKRGLFSSIICKDYTLTRLGLFATEIEAAKAYDDASEIMYGDRPNELLGIYDA